MAARFLSFRAQRGICCFVQRVPIVLQQVPGFAICLVAAQASLAPGWVKPQALTCSDGFNTDDVPGVLGHDIGHQEVDFLRSVPLGATTAQTAGAEFWLRFVSNPRLVSRVPTENVSKEKGADQMACACFLPSTFRVAGCRGKMGHGWRNYLMVAFKDLRGIGRVSGLDKRLPILGTVDQA